METVVVEENIKEPQALELKDNSCKKNMIQCAIRSIGAGVWVALAVFVYVMVCFHTDSKVLGSLAFAFFFVLILFMETDLFTSKTLMFITDAFNKKRTFLRAFGLLWWVLLFNVIGIILTCIVISLTNQSSEFLDLFQHMAASKAGTTPLSILMKGILCTLFVSAATFFAVVYKNKPMVAITLMVLTIGMFVILGLEHSVANFAWYMLSILWNNGLSASSITVGLVLSILGNLIGSGFVILFLRTKKFGS